MRVTETCPAFLAGVGEMGGRIRAHEWAATPLGPPEAWPQTLQTLTALMLASSQPMFVVWGPERTTIYNDGYSAILAGKHPALGQPFDQIWYEIWDRDLKPIVARAYAGEALHMDDMTLLMERKGYPEETHFSFSYTPVRDAAGAVQGFFCPCLEITEQVLEERRARLRADLTERLRSPGDPARLAFDAAALLARHLQSEQAAYAEIDESGRYAAIARDWNDGRMESNAGRHRLDDFGPAFIADLKSGQSLAIGDVRDDPRTATPEALAAFGRRGIRAFLNIPRIRHGRLVAVLAVHTATPRHWHPADVALAEEVADRVNLAVERARAEAAARNSEARLAAVFEILPVGVGEVDADGKLVRSNREMHRYMPTGLMPSRDAARLWRWRAWRPDGRRVEPNDFPDALALRGDKVVPGLEMLYREGDDKEVWTQFAAVPIRNEEGRITGSVIVVTDIHALKRADAALRESEARFRQFGEASPDALWVRNAETLEWEYLSPAFDSIYGIDRHCAVASRSINTLRNIIVPEDREATLEAIRQLRDGDRDYEYRIRRPSDGQVRWLRTTGFRLMGDDGRVRRLGGITHDATEEKLAADRMEVLVAELQHRTRNLMAVIRSVANRTLASSASLDDFTERFGDRIDALARVNGLLSRLEEGDRISFDELVRTELSGHGLVDHDGHAPQVSLNGPAGIELRSATVQTLALALHELLTNAMKHGALSRPEGHLSIEWTIAGVDGEPHLRVQWKEAGVPVTTPGGDTPLGSGYGRELIERALPYQLGAETRYDLRPEGLRCTIVLPVSSRFGHSVDGE